MNLTDFFFIVVAGITLIGAFFAVCHKSVFYNALSLILCLFGVAGIFIFLNSEFLAVVEVIIYIGAISIAIIFAIMLSRPLFEKTKKLELKKVLRSFVIAGLLFVGLVKVVRLTQWPVTDPVQGDYSMRAVGKSFLTTNLLPFEAISLILVVAIIGALLISNDRSSR